MPPGLAFQNRTSELACLREIQKSNPSLQTPSGWFARAWDPRGVSPAAFQRETPLELVTRTLSPSKPATAGVFRPFPVSVARTAPLEARTIETDADPAFGTQMFAPSKTGY